MGWNTFFIVCNCKYDTYKVLLLLVFMIISNIFTENLIIDSKCVKFVRYNLKGKHCRYNSYC
jgi:hypothetical protein